MTHHIKAILILLVTFIILPLSTLKAQKGLVTAEISYPVQVGDNFFTQYDGTVSLDLGYSYPLNTSWSLEGQAGYTYSKNSFYSLFLEKETVNRAHIFELLAGPSLDIPMAQDMFFSPFLSLGYASAGFSNNDFNESYRSNGFNSEIGASFDFTGLEKLGIGFYGSYQFIYLEQPENASNISYNRKMQLINFGVKLTYDF